MAKGSIAASAQAVTPPAVRLYAALKTLLVTFLACLVLLGPGFSALHAQSAAFDLSGPSLRATVTHAGVTLPLSKVPNLTAGDRVRIAAELPTDQSARYHLVLVFLRGATNPPPKGWLFDAETWKPKKATLDVAVPAGAQQALALLVPDVGGAVDAVFKAVREKPGAFVRASQELNQAMLDRARLEAFLDHVRRGEALGRTATVSPQLAQSLAVKLDADCLLRQPDTQAACLTQGSNAMVLADSQTSSIAQTLAGAPADIALQLSATPQGGFGYYSPYIGVVRDLARILGAFQSAQLQFIPALSVQQGAATKLLLNTAPSFRKPQSVLVAALPTVAEPSLPPLKSKAEGGICISRPGLVLPVGGAPLVFATDYARQVALSVPLKTGRTLDFPLLADPARGGYALSEEQISAAGMDAVMTGTVHGLWGFQPFQSAQFRLEAPVSPWRVIGDASLVAGRDGGLLLGGGAASCVSDVAMQRGTQVRPVEWAAEPDGGVSVKVPLAGVAAGPFTILVRHFGVEQPQRFDLRAFAEASSIASFGIQAGDSEGVLTGTRLDQVASIDIGGVTFRPGELRRVNGKDELVMAGDPSGVAALRAGETRAVEATLSDGRVLRSRASIGAPRPKIVLLSKSAERVGPAPAVPVTLDDPNLIPADSRLTFSFKAVGPTRLAAGDKVEIAVGEGAPLAVALQLQDAQVAIATVEPSTAFGASAFGPLRFRVVQNGVTSAWQPVAKLVRLPTIASFNCPAGSGPCTLQGTNLFLINSLGAGENRTLVADGFTGSTLQVPRPANGRVTLALRDQPDAVVSFALND